jgi:hypothetical protein
MVKRDESDNRLENLEKAWKAFGKHDRSQCKANLQAVWHWHVLCGCSRISKGKKQLGGVDSRYCTAVVDLA